ncbi:GBLP protein, partial [Acromyrmex insinuator]
IGRSQVYFIKNLSNKIFEHICCLSELANMREWFRDDIMGMKLKMEDKNSKELSNIIIDSTVQNDVSEIYFNKTPTPSIASIVTNERCTPLSVSMQTISDIEHRYQLVGNIDIINQMEVNQDVLCICYTENYDFLAAGLSDGNVKFYKVDSGEDTLILCDTEIMLNPSPVTAVKHRPVSKTHPITHTVIATYANGCVKCWHYPTAQCLYTIRERRQTLGLAYHPQLPKFVTVGDDTILYLFLSKHLVIFECSDKPDVMDGHKSRVFSACFNPKSAYELISGGWDDTIQFWDTRQAHSFRFISGVHICGDGLDINRNGKESLLFYFRYVVDLCAAVPKISSLTIHYLRKRMEKSINLVDRAILLQIHKDPRPRLLKNDVVYKINYNNCDASYVGQTNRQLRILTCAWQRNNPLQLWDYGSGKLITTIEPDSYSSLLYVGKYITNMYIACGGCDVNLFRIVDLRSHSTIAMIKNLKSGVYSLDVGPLESKYSKRILPKFAFCAGTTIFEVDAQPD